MDLAVAAEGLVVAAEEVVVVEASIEEQVVVADIMGAEDIMEGTTVDLMEEVAAVAVPGSLGVFAAV